MDIALMTVIVIFLSAIFGFEIARYFTERRRDAETRRDTMTLKNLVTALVNQRKDQDDTLKRLESIHTCTLENTEKLMVSLQATMDKQKTVDNAEQKPHTRDWRREWEALLPRLATGKQVEIADDDARYMLLHNRRRTITEAMVKEVERMIERGA